jgi:hypothetical protein
MVGAYAAVQFAGAAEGGPQGHTDIADTTVRQSLTVCVDVPGTSGPTDNQIQRVHSELVAAVSGAPSAPTWYRDPRATAGCPAPAVEIGEAADKWLVEGRRVSQASTHAAFTFFLSDDLYADTFGDDPYAVVNEEFVCEGDSCWTVTTGLYVPSSASDATLLEGLLQAIGLLQPPELSEAIDWSACEMGEFPHPDLDCDRFAEWKRQQQELH